MEPTTALTPARRVAPHLSLLAQLPRCGCIVWAFARTLRYLVFLGVFAIPLQAISHR